MAEPNQLARVSGQSGGQISVTSCRNGLVVTQFLVRAFLVAKQTIRRVTAYPNDRAYRFPITRFLVRALIRIRRDTRAFVTRDPATSGGIASNQTRGANDPASQTVCLFSPGFAVRG
jgi:hypothetical protein